MLNTKHSATFITQGKNGERDLVHGSLRPGNIYLIEWQHFFSDLLDCKIYLDDRIVASFIKKIVTEKKIPLIAFTQVDSEFKIVSGEHVVEAASRLGIDHIKGIFVPRSALESEQVEQIFF